MTPTETKLREALEAVIEMAEGFSCGECCCRCGPREEAFSCCDLVPVTGEEEHGCDDCSDVRQTLEGARAALALPPSRASGSRTHGGAVGHVAALRVEVERLRAALETLLPHAEDCATELRSAIECARPEEVPAEVRAQSVGALAAVVQARAALGKASVEQHGHATWQQTAAADQDEALPSFFDKDGGK